jgi:predicted CopG family antitoxin
MISINHNDIQKNESIYRPKEISDPYYFKNPELFELYKKSLPPKEAYYYFPKGDEIIIHHEKKPEKSLRRIFLGVPYLEIEEKWIMEFKSEIAAHPEIRLPEYWNDAINLRFVYATECNIKKSFERMVRYLQWHKNMFPMNISPGDKIFKLLNLGFLYVYGRDHQFRPILVCQPYIIQKSEKDYNADEVIKASAFLFQYIVNNMLIPGQIENWIMILNFEGTSPLNIPDSVKQLIKTLSENFLSRLYKCYVFGMSFLLNCLYKIICNFLEEITVQKITVLEKKNINRLFEIIRMDNIEKKFGGTAPDAILGLPNSIFPPRMPSNYFLKEEENPNQILITEEEYIKLVENNKIREDCISPYIKDLLEKRQKNLNYEMKMKQFINSKDWKMQNEFDGKNKINKFIKSNNNLIYDLKSFNLAKNSFHKSINLLGDNK